MSRRPIHTLILTLLLACAAPAVADEGRIPIFQPTVITAPGHYVVTRNITVAAGNAILVRVDNVEIDLNGHRILDPTGFGATAILIEIQSDVSDVVIRNGFLAGGRNAIRYVAAAGTSARLRIEDVDFRNTSEEAIFIDGAENVEVLGCRLSDIAEFSGGSSIQAIDVRGNLAWSSGRFIGNKIQRARHDALSLTNLYSAEVRENVITQYSMVCSSCGSGIRLVRGTGHIVEGNTVGQSNGPGISVGSHGTRVAHNVVTNNEEGGINIGSDGNHVVDNVVAHNGDNLDGPWGIFVNGSDNTIRGNEVRGNLGHGIHVFGGARNLIDNNISEGHAGFAWCGIQFDNGPTHAYRSNMLRGNAAGGVCGVANTNAGGNIL